MTSLFISCVSNEFGQYREAMRKDFARPNLAIHIQEDFYANGAPAMDKLDRYIQSAEAVIHICGNMTGAMANRASVDYINFTYPDFAKRFPVLQPVLEGQQELTYTQWEAYLALYHRKRLLVVAPAQKAQRHSNYKQSDEQIANQLAHLKRLQDTDLGIYTEITFRNQDELVKKIYQSSIGEIIFSIPSIKSINLPYQSIGDSFKGREKFRDELYSTRPSANGGVKGIAIYGLGGIGKTRVAVEYAWQHKNDYTALLFIDAGSPENFTTNIANFSGQRVLHLEGLTEADEQAKYNAVINRLNQYKGWLLILDNADTIEAAEKVEEFFQQLQQGHVLVTTRLDDWSNQFQTMPLDLLHKEDAVSFLLDTTAEKRVKLINDNQLAGKIAEELGFLALTLEQARAYIAAKQISFAKYLEVWESNRKKITEAFDKRVTQYPLSFDITWQTSFDQLSANAKTLLNRLAWLAPDPIPKEMLELDVPQITAIDMENAWPELKKYSLASNNEHKTAFTIHRLVQDVARHNQDKISASRHFTEAVEWVNTAFDGDPQNVNDLPTMEPLIPHALYLFSYAEKTEAPISITRIMRCVELVFYTRAQFKLAESLMRRALQIDEKSYGPDHPTVAGDLNNLALMLKNTNRLEEAEPLMRRALEIDEKSYGPDHPTIARNLNNLALLLKDTNRLEESEPLMRRALQIDEKSYGPDHPNVAIHLNNLAQLLTANKRLEEAEEMIRRALEIDKKSYGPDHPNVARDLNNLGQLLKDTNRLEEAESLMRRALEICEKSYGPDHPKVSIRLYNLALLLKDTNRLEEAESLMRRAYKNFSVSFDSKHPNVQTVLSNYTILLREMGRSEEEIKMIVTSE